MKTSMRPHVRGVILEGLSTAGKTSVLKALKTAQSSRSDSERSVLILGEHYSQQLQIIEGELKSLSCEEHVQLIESRIDAIENLNDWAIHLGPGKRRSRGLFFVFERFHLNHRSVFGNTESISRIENRISAVGGVCILLTISPNYVRERLLSRDSDIADIDRACNE